MESSKPLSRQIISGVIRRKIGYWLAHIDDIALRADVAKSVIVSGGCIASMLLRSKVNDYDIYLTDKEVLIRLMKYYLKKFASNPPPKLKYNSVYNMSVNLDRDYPRCIIKSAGVVGGDAETEENDAEIFSTTPEPKPEAPDMESGLRDKLKTTILDAGADSLPVDNPDVASLIADVVSDEFAGKTSEGDNKYRPIFITTNAITLSDKIQIVTRFFGTPEEIHKNFDFVHCTNYYVNATDQLVLPPAALESLLFMQLAYVGSLYPLCSLIRLRKFAKRGWNYGFDVVIAAAVQCHDIDLYDLTVLEEQLIGVDAGYMNQVIELLKAGKAAGQALNATYLIKVLNEVFHE